MGKGWRLGILSLFLLTSFIAAKAAETPEAKKEPKVRYEKGSDLDFEALLIKGQESRPEVSVVTGNVNQGGDGLLRLRSDFLDKVTVDFGEKLE